MLNDIQITSDYMSRWVVLKRRVGAVTSQRVLKVLFYVNILQCFFVVEKFTANAVSVAIGDNGNRLIFEIWWNFFYDLFSIKNVADVNSIDSFVSKRNMEEFSVVIMKRFTCFPNGLAFCPRKFTKLLKPVFATLRQKGDIVSGYIDDTFLVGDSVEDCWNNVLDTVNMFQNLGFVIHPDKSVFEPTQKLVFLGFIIDSKNMTVSLTDEKARKLVNL